MRGGAARPASYARRDRTRRRRRGAAEAAQAPHPALPRKGEGSPSAALIFPLPLLSSCRRGGGGSGWGGKPLAQARHLAKRVAQSRKVTRPAPTERQPRERALDIGTAPQGDAEVVANPFVPGEKLHCI